jgi:deazaflavin-dependent oxidoreductase (nitroreductase family)
LSIMEIAQLERLPRVMSCLKVSRRMISLDGRKVIYVPKDNVQSRIVMPSIIDLTNEQFLYLTTIGRKSGLPREIEIWFVTQNGKYYIFAEHQARAQWVKNILKNPRVRVRVGKQVFEATARVIEERDDREDYAAVRQLEFAKYNWGDGLPVEIVPYGQA